MTASEARYFDRKKSVLIPEGQPKYPNWQALLAIGPAIVAYSSDYPFIENACADGYAFPSASRRPAVFNGALIAQWLDSEEKAACAALRHAWGMLGVPDCRDEALEMLDNWNTHDCMALYGRHRLRYVKASRPTLGYEPVDAGEWAVACCQDCLRPLLWYFPTDDHGVPKTWPFFDMSWTLDRVA